MPLPFRAGFASRCPRAAARFRRDCDGNVAMMVAFAFVAIMVAAGAAIDYGRAVDEKARMQAAFDSAVQAAATHSGDEAAKRVVFANAFGNVYTDYNQTDPSLTNLSLAACNAAKNEPGVEIYAIAVSSGAGPGTSAYDVLSRCASTSAHFFYATDAAALNRAFENIAKESTTLRRTM